MAKPITPELRRFLRIGTRLANNQEVPFNDKRFYIEFQSEIDEETVRDANEIISTGKLDGVDANVTTEQLMALSWKALQDPSHREDMLKLGEEADTARTTSKLQQGFNVLLGIADIAQSTRQIKEGEKLAKNSRRPTRPTVPQRDMLLQQALRNAEESTFDAARATAPIEQQIQDNYLADVQAAKTASTGQSGTYGAYRQIASNNRNRAALQLAPIQDAIRRGQQDRYDNLLGMRMDETQNIYRNQAALYPYELDQYSKDQAEAAKLAGTGRQNLRASLYNVAPPAADLVGRAINKRRYDQLRNQAHASGMGQEAADIAINAARDLDKYYNLERYNTNYRPNYNPQTMFEQSYIG